MRQRSRIALLVAIVGLLVACGSSGGTGDGSAGDYDTEGAHPDVAPEGSGAPVSDATDLVDDVPDPSTDEASAPVTGDPICLKAATQLHQNPHGRFLVADLEVRNEAGHCKGVREVLPPGLRIDGRPAQPMIIAPGHNGCSGQTISLCIREGQNVRLDARFAISSHRFSPGASYYAAVNHIHTRHGDGRTRSPSMIARDEMMGGVDEKLLSVQGSPLYNFLNFLPDPGYAGEPRNGIHRYPDGREDDLGSPASHGCFRISRNGTRVVRFRTAIGTKLYVLYRHSAPLP